MPEDLRETKVPLKIQKLSRILFVNISAKTKHSANRMQIRCMPHPPLPSMFGPLILSFLLQILLHCGFVFLSQSGFAMLFPQKILPTLLVQAFSNTILWQHFFLGLTGHAALLLLTAWFCAYPIPCLMASRLALDKKIALFAINTLWFVLTVSLNSFLFPHSVSRLPPSFPHLAGIAIPAILLCAILCLSIFARVKAKNYKLAVTPLLLILMVSLAAIPQPVWKQTAGKTPLTPGSPPHLILIGIDSLRPDETIIETPRSLTTPNLNRFFKKAVVFPEAYTPIARTFPAWVSILTGKLPWEVGVPFNLTHPDPIAYEVSFPHTLKQMGYRTIFATDEKRFSNIDRAFGFDEIIGPVVGASDFILGSLNDTPLGNLFVNGRFGAFFFPFSHGNRPAFATYAPETFPRMVKQALPSHPNQPHLICIHLCMPHHPYLWQNAPKQLPTETKPTTMYRDALAVADLQFQEIMDFLHEYGYLQNAIVTVLSDHGEAIGMRQTFENKETLERHDIEFWGHGTSVLSQAQYRVVLGFRHYGNKPMWKAGNRTATASLADIFPTLFHSTKIKSSHPDRFGISLLPAISDPSFRPKERTILLETGLNPEEISVTTEMPDAEEVQAGMQLYEIDPVSGRLYLKEETITHEGKRKEFAAIKNGRFVAALPQKDREPMGYQYAFRPSANSMTEIHTRKETLPESALSLLQELETRRQFRKSFRK